MSAGRAALAACAALLLAGARIAAAAPLEGTWSGRFEREGSTLEVELTFTRGAEGCSGSFSSEPLRVVGIPLEDVRCDSARVAWRLVGDATTTEFAGTLRGDALDGELREGEARGTFALRRAAAPTALVQETPIRFANGAIELRGALLVPEGPGPFPGIVLLHGSGAEGRSASRHLAQAFVRRGVAALIYDKRGVGESGGDWRTAGFEELVGDAVAAVAALRAQPRIERVGIHGHSQSGTYAPSVARASPHVAFVIASAASGVSMADAETYSLDNALGVRALPDAERALAERFVRAIVATAYQGAARAELERARDAARDRAWMIELPPPQDVYWSFAQRTAAYAPLEHWRRVSVPALLVYGEDDARVPARRSAAGIAAAYLEAQGHELDVLLFPGADHTFRLTPLRNGAFEWPRTAPGYPGRLVDWVLRVTSSGR
jgi:alpha-beta hydrolase superfamily lysophospholipase